MPVPVELRRGIADINERVRAAVGSRPLFSWQWGEDLVAIVPRIDLATGRQRYTPDTRQTKSGLYIVQHETDMQPMFMVSRAYHQSFVFCYEDLSRQALARWNPWCPEAYTRDGYRVPVIHSPRFTLPTLDYVHEVCRQVRTHLDELARSTREQRTQKLIEAASVSNEAKHLRTRESVRMAVEKLPVGGFRKPGDKTHVSFSGAAND